MVHAGTPLLKIKELPNALKGGNCYDLPFPALSIVRWGNAFTKEALLLV
jgi:hypothetical protein